MSTTIDRLQIEIESSSKSATEGLERLKSTLKSLDKISKSSGLDNVCTKLKKISAINFSNLKPLSRLGDSTHGIGKLCSKVGKLSASLGAFPKSVDVNTNGDHAATDLNSIAESADNLPKNAEVSIDTPGADQAAAKTERVKNGISGIGRSAQKASYDMNTFWGQLNRASAALDKTTKKAGALSNILKIVVVYGGAFRMFSMLTQGVSEGLENVARYNRETAAAMSQLSTMSLTLKNSIGAALYPALVAITPVLNTITNAIARVCEVMSQLISMLSGKSTYLRAKPYTKAYVDAVGKAGSKATKSAKDTAKEIKKTFAGLDEITTIGDKSNDSAAGGGGTGGGGAGGDDYGSMFEEVPISDKMLALKKHLNDILPVVEAIGAGFAAWKIAKETINAIQSIASFFQNKELAWSISFAGVSMFLSDLDRLRQYIKDFQENGASFENVAGMISEFAGLIGDSLVLLGNLKLAAPLKAIQGIGEIVIGIKKIADNGVNFESVMTIIRGMTNLAIAVGLFTGNLKLVGVSIAIQGFTAVIEELGKNWEAIKNGDWSGVDKITLVIGAIEMLGGIVTALSTFSALKKTKDVSNTAKEIKEVTTTAETISTSTSTLTQKLKDLSVNLGLGIAIIAEVALAAGMIVASIWGLGLLLEQVGEAWQPVINNGQTVALAIGIGTGILVTIGAAAYGLGTLGGEVCLQIGIGTGILVELGIATGLFIAEIWGIGYGLDEIGKAWQPVLDNGESIAKSIGIGTGLLVGIGVVTAALGAATVASAGTIPLAIGLGTALLVELGIAFVAFVDELIKTANKLSNDLDPALDRLNSILPDLTRNMSNFTKFMKDFAQKVIDYTKSSAISGFSSTVNKIIGFFTSDPIKSMAKDVEKQYKQSITLNEKLRKANPELQTVISLITTYYGFLEEIERLTGKSNNISLAQGMFVSMKEVGKNLILGFVDGMKSENSTLSNGIKTVLQDSFTDKVASSCGYDFGAAIGQGIARGLKNTWFPTLKGTVSVAETGKVSLKLKAYAQGGFPEDGLFMANHGELVGQFSNGKTAVANNEQIVEGIQSGVYAANQEQNYLLREQNKLLRQIAEKESNGELNISTITKAITRKNRRDGRTIIPVGT